jgi:hypothetical protein
LRPGDAIPFGACELRVIGIRHEDDDGGRVFGY